MATDPLDLGPILPWEKQATESAADFELFRKYRDRAAPRGKVIGPGMGATAHVFKLFQDFHWKERVEAYDRYLERIQLNERAAFVALKAKDRAADHMALTHELYEVAHREARKLLQASIESEGAGLIVRPAELIKMVELVIKMERLVLGESTANVEVKGPDLSKLSLDEVSQLEELLSRANDAETPKEPH